MSTDIWLSFISYSLITTFTPGPNNISSTSAGMKYGYKKSVNYLFGIGSGFFLVMLLSGFLTSYLSSLNKTFFLLLKWLGALYIIYLALVPFLPSKKRNQKPTSSNYTFMAGFGLQFVNIKGILFGTTTFSTFNLLIARSNISVILSSFFLALMAFSSISLWTITGTTLSKYFTNRTFFNVFNGILAILLIYIALSILL